MSIKFLVFVVASGSLIHITCAQSVVSLITNDVSPETSFTMGAKWSDGLVPHADADYWVEGYTLRSPGSTATFAGHSLTLTNSGLLTLLTANRITISNLQMRSDGRIHNGVTGGTVMLAGTADIQTMPGNYFYFTGRGNKGLIYSALSGDGALAFQIAAGGAGTLDYTLLGDNSGFTGKIRVMGIAGKDTSLTLDNPSTVQSALPSFTADSILLLTNAMLTVNVDTTLSASANRGITIQNGGMLGAAAGATFKIDTPVTGDTVTKILPGTLALTAANTFTNLVVSNGTVRLSQAGALQGVSVTAGALESSASLTDLTLAGGLLSAGLTNTVAHLQVDHLTLSGGGLSVNLADSTQDVVSVTTLVKSAGVVTPLVLTGLATTNNVDVRSLFVASALDTMTEADFVLSYAQPGLHLPEGSLEIIRGSGIPYLAFHQVRPVVVQTKTVASGIDGFSKSDYWSDGQIPSAANDYVLNQGFSLYGVTNFPGHSLSVAHESAILTLKKAAMDFPDLRLYQGRIHNGISGGTVDLSGLISVYATDASPFQITGNGNTINCVAGLKGSGAVKITMASGASNFRFNLYADNSAFTGAFIATNYPGSGNAVRIGIAHDAALGGALPSFRSDAICFGSGTYIYALSNVTLSAENRGITQAGTCSYWVPTNTTLAIENVISGSILKKTDDGLLILSATNTFSGFIADRGSVEARNEQALGVKTVQFLTNTVLRLQAGRNKLENGVRLTQTTPLNATDEVVVMPVFEEDEVIPVKFELPIFLINSGSELNATLTLKGLPKYTTQIITRSVDVSGTTRTLVLATYTFGGTVLMLR